ncbi:acyl-CoA synthetase [Sporichthya brevicatena]|uniref:Acyl-CoA synthetase n=1 Tax=Sporichthya brevicatena TaxID=171442 RepID=A0ABN1H4E4_9ACTN
MTDRQVSFAFGDLWELVSAAVPDRTALVCESTRLTFAELDERAAQLAGWLAAQGVVPGSYVGVQMRNRSEHVETMLAAYKLRAVPVNINYRFGPQELRYLYADAGLSGVVHDEDLREAVDEARQDVPGLTWTLEAGTDFGAAVGASSPAAVRPRSGDDVYALYTGGTTGHPKAVEWRMEDAFFACVGGGDPTGDRGPVSTPTELLDRLLEDRAFLPAPPLVHAAGMWTTLRWLFAGCKVVLVPRFDPADIWRHIARERVTTMNIVGDAMARPLVSAVPESADLTCLRTVATGGAGLSPAVRSQLLAALPWLTVKDSYGSSETGVHGWGVSDSGRTATGFSVVDTVLFDPQTRAPKPAGAPGPGLVARRGRVPLRYRGDAAKSGDTFVTIDGERYALTGDLAELDPDGQLRLIGRGSQCINSGGEKIFPEEVEQILREHPDVIDAVVVGLPDERWGQKVAALVAPSDGASPNETNLRRYCRERLAGYKVPKHVFVVPAVERTIAGKLDYRWASGRAATLARAQQSSGSAPMEAISS